MDNPKYQQGYLGIGNRRILGKDLSPGGNEYGFALENGDAILLENGDYLILESN